MGEANVRQGWSSIAERHGDTDAGVTDGIVRVSIHLELNSIISIILLLVSRPDIFDKLLYMLLQFGGQIVSEHCDISSHFNLVGFVALAREL